MADVNGDGRADIVGFSSDGVYTSLAQANGTYTAATRVSSEFVLNSGWNSNDSNPYQMTRRVLEDAGATPDLAGLKHAWLKTCPMSDSDLKARISASADVLKTLLEDSPRRFSQFESETRNRFNRESVLGSEPKGEELESKLRKIALQGYELPADLAIKPPKAEFGATATTLSGWWLCQISFPLKFELVLIFEEFKSAHEVVMITATKTTTSRPARSRRVTATVDGDVVTFLVGDQSPATFTLQSDDALQGEFVTRDGKARFPFRKGRPEPHTSLP